MDGDTKRELKRLANRPLAEIRTRFTELTGETNRTPNKKFLLRRIQDALDAGETARSARARATTTARTQRGDGLTKMSVAALQALYQEVVGRATESDNAPYLVWKVREARKGRIRVGPARQWVAQDDLQHVPFTLPRATVLAMDAARARLGFKTRQAMLHHAMHELLVARGEGDVAHRFHTSGE